MSNTTRRVDIFDNSTGEYLAKGLDCSDITEALVSEFCNDQTPDDIRQACEALGDAYAHCEPTEAYEAYLNVTITDC